MVLIFKTNIQTIEQSSWVTNVLQAEFLDSKITIDLGDSDKVLRLECKKAKINQVSNIVKSMNFKCEKLKDKKIDYKPF